VPFASLFGKTKFLVLLLSWLILVASTMAVSCDQVICISAINPSEVYLGDTVHVYGGGATPRSKVIAKLVGLPEDAVVNNMTLGSTVAGETGDWQVDFVTPLLSPGNYTIHVFDDRNVPSNLASFRVLWNITIVPITNFTYGEVTNMTWLSVPLTNTTLPILGNTTLPILFFVPFTAAPASGPPGTFVTISGHHASGGEIQVYLNDTEVATIVKPSSGDWSTSFQIPKVPLGNYTIRAVDIGARIISYASFSVTLEVASSTALLLLLIGMFALAVFSSLALLGLMLFASKSRHKKPMSNRKSKSE
jgi:hypothetical protein